jgi:hypothetical protein
MQKRTAKKNLWPESDFSPLIQMWYNRIHRYLQLIRLREGKASNASNIVRFAKRKHIKQPEELTMEELKETSSNSAESGRQSGGSKQKDCGRSTCGIVCWMHN